MSDGHGMTLRLRGPVWVGEAPTPLDNPELYDELLRRRILASAIDFLLLLALSGAIWLAAFVATGMTFGLMAPIIWPLQVVAASLLPVAYFTWMIGSGGSTAGMYLLDLEVRGYTGSRLDYIQAFVRAALFLISFSLPLVFLVPLFNERKRCLHDYLSGSLVVRTSAVKATLGFA